VTQLTHTTSDPAARLRSVHAGARLAEALQAIALDAVDPSGPAHLTAPEWQRVCDLLEGPVEAVAGAAIASLTLALEDASRACEPALRRRLEALQMRAHLGVD
jgi:hypothetical protein